MKVLVQDSIDDPTIRNPGVTSVWESVTISGEPPRLANEHVPKLGIPDMAYWESGAPNTPLYLQHVSADWRKRCMMSGYQSSLTDIKGFGVKGLVALQLQR